MCCKKNQDHLYSKWRNWKRKKNNNKWQKKKGTLKIIRSSALLLFAQFLVDHFAKLAQDFDLTLLSLFSAEHGQRPLLVGRVNLVFLTQTDGFHSPMSAIRNMNQKCSIMNKWSFKVTCYRSWRNPHLRTRRFHHKSNRFHHDVGYVCPRPRRRPWRHLHRVAKLYRIPDASTGWRP